LPRKNIKKNISPLLAATKRQKNDFNNLFFATQNTVKKHHSDRPTDRPMVIEFLGWACKKNIMALEERGGKVTYILRTTFFYYGFNSEKSEQKWLFYHKLILDCKKSQRQFFFFIFNHHKTSSRSLKKRVSSLWPGQFIVCARNSNLKMVCGKQTRQEKKARHPFLYHPDYFWAERGLHICGWNWKLLEKLKWNLSIDFFYTEKNICKPIFM